MPSLCLLLAAAAVSAPLPSPFFDLPPASAAAPCLLADGATRTFPRIEVRQERIAPGAALELAPATPVDQVVVVRAGALTADVGKGPQPAPARAVILAVAGARCVLRNPGAEPAVCDVARFYPPAGAKPAAGAAVSQVVEWSAAKPRPFAEGERRSLLNTSTSGLAHLRIHATTLNPHAAGNPVHSHPWEELTLVLDGAMQALVGPQRHKLETGSACIELAGGDQTYANPYADPTTFVIIEAIPPGIAAR